MNRVSRTEVHLEIIQGFKNCSKDEQTDMQSDLQIGRTKVPLHLEPIRFVLEIMRWLALANQSS